MIRSTLKRGLKKALDLASGRPETPGPDVTRAWQAETANRPPTPEPQAELELEPESPATEPPATEPPATEAPATEDIAGLPLTMDAVQEILDEMVRPALQGDGGDISLVKIEDNDVYVQLVGACNTCPSATATMKLGVEALFREEFPTMRDLIQVD